MSRGLIVVLLLIEGVAWADDSLDRARKAVADSDYAAAREPLAAALAGGGHSPDEMVEIYRLSGTVAAALGDARAATEAFTHLLALSPKTTLPPGTSPKIRRPFEAAGRYFTTHRPLELRLDTSATVMTLVTVSDPLGMVATAQAELRVDGGAEQIKRVAAAERAEIALPPGREIIARVAALDRHGNRLVELGSPDAPIVIAGEPPPPAVIPAPAPGRVSAEAAARPLYLRWWPYAAAAVAFGGATAYFGLSARSDANELQDLVNDRARYSAEAARPIEDRARRNVRYTNICLAVSGAFAITSGVMVLIAPRGAEARIAAVPVHGGGALVLGGKF